MTQMINFAHNVNPHQVRIVIYNSESCYHIVDYIMAYRNIDRKTAKNYYYVLMSRLRQNKETLPRIIKLKSTANDGKSYITDFTTNEGILELQKHMDKTIEQEIIRKDIRQDDEVECFQPIIVELLENAGWKVESQVYLVSGCIVDIIAFRKNEHRTIECKPKLPKNKLFQAIGQVLCYASELSIDTQPCIATKKDQITSYVEMCCKSLNIAIIAI